MNGTDRTVDTEQKTISLEPIVGYWGTLGVWQNGRFQRIFGFIVGAKLGTLTVVSGWTVFVIYAYEIGLDFGIFGLVCVCCKT